MDIAYVNGQMRALAAGALLLLTLALGGCATSTAGLSLMDARARLGKRVVTSRWKICRRLAKS